MRGAGYKFINMGEIFAYNRIGNIETERVQLNEKEKKEMTLQKNDLLFARQSLVFTGAGKCSIMLDLEDVVSFESHIIRVRLNPEIANPAFYYYYFSLPYNSVKTIVQQCAQAGIRGSDLEKIKVPCPHIEIQNQIADVLSAYDDLIDANNRMVSCIGTAGVVSINAEPAHTNQQINSIILNNPNELEWLYHTCKSLKDTIELFGATGATMTNLSKGKFEKLKVVDPREDLILEYHNKVHPLFNEIKSLMYQNQNLAAQRDMLLPRLMSGKLEV